MKIFITGATGFVGRALTLRLLRERHEVVAWVRSKSRARQLLGDGVAFLPTDAGPEDLAAALTAADAVINLAGEPIFSGRWTRKRRSALRASRVDLTDQIVETMKRIENPPRVLLSASAVGYYGDRGEEILDESSSPGTDFLAELCQDWERAARAAEATGTRVATIRIGLVLGREGGLLGRILPIFRLGLGGRLGSGRQYMPWIHIEDLCEVFAQALVDERFQGPINGTSPGPRSNRDFTRGVAKILGRPAIFPVPKAALRIALGSAAGAIVGGQRAVPEKLQKWGFEFRYPDLFEALGQLCAEQAQPELGPAKSPPSSPYLEVRKPKYALHHRCFVPAPIDEVFSFFSSPDNLGAITPAGLGLKIQGPRGRPVGAGSHIEYTLRIGPIPWRWRTEFERWEPGESFVDVQTTGPYRAWWHEHRFQSVPGGTVMEDHVYYAPPLGWLGRIANRLFVAPLLRRIFSFRADAIALRFGREGRNEEKRAA